MFWYVGLSILWIYNENSSPFSKEKFYEKEIIAKWKISPLYTNIISLVLMSFQVSNSLKDPSFGFSLKFKPEGFLVTHYDWMTKEVWIQNCPFLWLLTKARKPSLQFHFTHSRLCIHKVLCNQRCDYHSIGNNIYNLFKHNQLLFIILDFLEKARI